MNRKTVFNWLVKLEQSGDCHDRKQLGSKGKLTKEQKEKLKKIIDSGPRSYGHDTDLWTLKSISEVISREFDVIYNTRLESIEKSRLFCTVSSCGGHGEETRIR